MVKQPPDHTHTYCYPPAEGRSVLVGTCACGAVREGMGQWTEVYKTGTPIQPYQPPTRVLPARDRGMQY